MRRDRRTQIALAIVNGEGHGEKGATGWTSRLARAVPSFDLVVATVGRTDELARLLESLEAQGYPRVRVIVVDQNADERLQELLLRSNVSVEHVRAEAGLSRARNTGLELVDADLVAFPDDDCVYPPGLQAGRRGRDRGCRPRRREGRAEDAAGILGLVEPDAAILADDNLWNRGISFTIFLRRALVERVGLTNASGSVAGAMVGRGNRLPHPRTRAGARIAYDPVVRHAVRRTTPSRCPRQRRRRLRCASTTIRRGSSRACSSASRRRARVCLGSRQQSARYRLATFRGRTRPAVRGARRSQRDGRAGA